MGKKKVENHYSSVLTRYEIPTLGTRGDKKKRKKKKQQHINIPDMHQQAKVGAIFVFRKMKNDSSAFYAKQRKTT